MTRKILLLIVLLIFVISSITLFFIIQYLDPYLNELVAIASLGITVGLIGTSFFTLILYVFKKVYYRGEVFLSHVFSSLRQGFLLSLYGMGVVVFEIIGVFSIGTLFLLAIIFFFIELIFQNH